MLDMTVDLELIIFTKNFVILLVLVLFLNFTWIWQEDTEQEQEVSKLWMLKKLHLKIVKDLILLNSMILLLDSLFLIEFKEQVKEDTKEDLDLHVLQPFGKYYNKFALNKYTIF